MYFTEEIIGDNSALWFSPDGSRIAYVRFNDSLVSGQITLMLFYSWFINDNMKYNNLLITNLILIGTKS